MFCKESTSAFDPSLHHLWWLFPRTKGLFPFIRVFFFWKGGRVSPTIDVHLFHVKWNFSLILARWSRKIFQIETRNFLFFWFLLSDLCIVNSIVPFNIHATCNFANWKSALVQQSKWNWRLSFECFLRPIIKYSIRKKSFYYSTTINKREAYLFFSTEAINRSNFILLSMHKIYLIIYLVYPIFLL